MFVLTVTCDDHVSLLIRPIVKGSWERLCVTMKLNCLRDKCALQLIRYGQHRRNCNHSKYKVGTFVGRQVTDR
jgi:hypothetical protein